MRLIAALVVLLALVGTAAAQPSETTSSNPLAAAADALAAGNYNDVLGHADPAAATTTGDRAEAHRLRGLAHFFLEQFDDAEADFVAYLKLDLDAGLDPSQYPPEAVTFFEDVRSRHAAELRALRPRQRQWRLLNLLPPGGQIQNRHYTKAWVIGGAELALAATHITSYLVLRSWCRRDDFTCVSDGSDVPDAARRLRAVNYLSGVALIGVYVYGVIDGFRGFRRSTKERQPIVTAAPVEGGVVVGASMSF